MPASAKATASSSSVAISDSFARAGGTASRVALVAVLLGTAAFVLRARRSRSR